MEGEKECYGQRDPEVFGSKRRTFGRSRANEKMEQECMTQSVSKVEKDDDLWVLKWEI